jgi:alcohol dehydrogenase (NADP+)
MLPSSPRYAESVYNAKAYSAASAALPLAWTTIARRDPTEGDVEIEILYRARVGNQICPAAVSSNGFAPVHREDLAGDELGLGGEKKH